MAFTRKIWHSEHTRVSALSNFVSTKDKLLHMSKIVCFKFPELCASICWINNQGTSSWQLMNETLDFKSNCASSVTTNFSFKLQGWRRCFLCQEREGTYTFVRGHYFCTIWDIRKIEPFNLELVWEVDRIASAIHKYVTLSMSFSQLPTSCIHPSCNTPVGFFTAFNLSIQTTLLPGLCSKISPTLLPTSSLRKWWPLQAPFIQSLYIENLSWVTDSLTDPMQTSRRKQPGYLRNPGLQNQVTLVAKNGTVYVSTTKFWGCIKKSLQWEKDSISRIGQLIESRNFWSRYCIMVHIHLSPECGCLVQSKDAFEFKKFDRLPTISHSL